MKISQCNAAVRQAKRLITKKAPEILIAGGITGMVSATVMGITATPKALRLIEEAEAEKEEELTKPEVVKVVWKCYLPTVFTTLVSGACIVGASSIHIRRNAALATAYKISESTFKEYKDKVLEKVGPKKTQEIRDDIAGDQIKKTPVSTSEVFITRKGETLCFEPISGRYFESDVDEIKRVENKLNKNMMVEMYCSMNDFVYELGLRPTQQGEDIGWSINFGLIDISFSAHVTDDNRPCLVLDYLTPPKYDFKDLI